MMFRLAGRWPQRPTMTTLAFKLLCCLGVILSFLELLTQTFAQSGFVSIDCGNSEASYNIELGSSAVMKWVNDDGYIATGVNADVPFDVSTSLDNYQALKNFRYFPEPRSKYCYELPTPRNNSVLIRAMFLHGDSNYLPLPTEFNISVNATHWASVLFNIGDDLETLSTPQVFEGIFFSPGNVIHFCMLPINNMPFISSLELRPLDPDGRMYSYQNSQTEFLWTLRRFNGGLKLPSASVRYPDDPYDRLWYPSGSWDNLNNLSAPQALGLFTSSSVNNVPPVVMKDAWVLNDSFWLNFANFDPSVTRLYAVTYFEEIFPLPPGAFREYTINFSADGSTTASAVVNTTVVARALWYHDWDIGATRHANITLISTSQSTIKAPLLNAVEVFGQFQFDFSNTFPKDVFLLQSLQTSFNLTDWQGDPCLPVAWNWVACAYIENIPSRVTKILLSGQGIKGFIPPEISQLTALTEIHLDNNSLSGTIPDGIATLPSLSVLLLNNNLLTGEIPAGLRNKTGLVQFTYYGNNLVGDLSPPPQPASEGLKSEGKSKISIGIIVGAAAAGVVLVLGSCLLLISCIIFRKSKKPSVAQGTDQAREVGPLQLKPSVPIGGLWVQSPTSLQPGSPSQQSPSSRPESPSSRGQASSRGQSSSMRRGKYSAEAVLYATKQNATKIGEGSYGSVYLGILDGKEVAVKINDNHSDKRAFQFQTEVNILTRVHHVNLVSLIGYCDEGESLILIYEYYPMGTLREWLYAENGKPVRGFLDWPKRLQIAADAARGLEYLHKGCMPSIVHCDLKSSNILLDEKRGGKVADFGLSKTTQDRNFKSGRFYTGIKGSQGYIDPECQKTSSFTEKSDVYSFGVVLVELISGRPPFSQDPDGNYITLIDSLKDTVRKNNIRPLADPRLRGDFDEESMWRVAEIALSCVRPQGHQRPDMFEVSRSLNMIEAKVRENA